MKVNQIKIDDSPLFTNYYYDKLSTLNQMKVSDIILPSGIIIAIKIVS